MMHGIMLELVEGLVRDLARSLRNEVYRLVGDCRNAGLDDKAEQYTDLLRHLEAFLYKEVEGCRYTRVR